MQECYKQGVAADNRNKLVFKIGILLIRGLACLSTSNGLTLAAWHVRM